MCSDWKTRSAREGRLFTNWCGFPGQICTQNGTLMRLDMRGFNLQCPFPATDLAVFTSLTTLNLGRNPNMTVRSRTLSHHPLPDQLQAVQAVSVSLCSALSQRHAPCVCTGL